MCNGLSMSYRYSLPLAQTIVRLRSVRIQTVCLVYAGKAHLHGRADQSSVNWILCLMTSKLLLCLRATQHRGKPIKGILDSWAFYRPNMRVWVCEGRAVVFRKAMGHHAANHLRTGPSDCFLFPNRFLEAVLSFRFSYAPLLSQRCSLTDPTLSQTRIFSPSSPTPTPHLWH